MEKFQNKTDVFDPVYTWMIVIAIEIEIKNLKNKFKSKNKSKFIESCF